MSKHIKLLSFFFFISFMAINAAKAEFDKALPNGKNETAFVTLSVKAFLQGAYNNNGLMNDKLRQKSLIPVVSPYNPGFTMNTSLLKNTGSHAIVDWVHIELRDGYNPRTLLGEQSALIQRDGRVVSCDGHTALFFEGLDIGRYYIVIRHRNHLAVMSHEPVLLDEVVLNTVDFTAGYAFGAKSMKINYDGTSSLFAGDANGDNTINSADQSMAWNERNQIGYLDADVSMDGFTSSTDHSMVWNNRNKSSQAP